uniref:Endochitinase n=1 Tax=Humulus lupulus TaxID=3486 RepID=Q9XFK6_HUMLU|nr:endochitinase precursor [Humulus lupulus]
MKKWCIIVLMSFLVGGALAEQCGRQAGGALCPNGLCCSQHGWCGTTSDYCAAGCQSQCSSTTPTPSGGGGGGSGDVSSVISSALFEEMLKHRNDGGCPGRGFYTYDAFLTAARSFNGFGTTGDDATRKREIAAFFGQTSHETTGGWGDAPDGPYAWGYCFVSEKDQKVNCDPNRGPCAPGKSYYGRGPIQLTHNYNYNLAGQALRVDLLNDPDRVATDAVVSFKTAIWFWMTPQANKPSSHDVIIGRWSPSQADLSARRAPAGYGVITNIINGGVECGKGPVDTVKSRIGFYQRYCGIFGVGLGTNLDCYNQTPFG